MGAGRSTAAGNDKNAATEQTPLQSKLYATAAGGVRERPAGLGAKAAFRSSKGDIFTWLSLFILPHCLFSAMMFGFVFFFYTKEWPFYLAVLVCVATPLDYGYRGFTAEPDDEKEFKKVRYQRFYAIVTAAASLFGLVFGYMIYDRIMHQYYAVQMGETYTNVVPSSHAAEFADATILSFDSTTRVDTGRAVGYASKNPGANQFCVAPVMGPNGLGQQDVQFWSIGENCCGHRGAFECGALVEKDTEVGKHCLVEIHPDPDFHEAISLASAENGLHSADMAMLCRFVDNIADDLYRQKVSCYWALAGAELLAFLVGGFVAQTYASKFG